MRKGRRTLRPRGWVTPEPVSHGVVLVPIDGVEDLQESAFSGQDPVSTLSESMHKPDQGVCTWPEFSAFNF